jgi:hypothetical protein
VGNRNKTEHELVALIQLRCDGPNFYSEISIGSINYELGPCKNIRKAIRIARRAIETELAKEAAKAR